MVFSNLDAQNKMGFPKISIITANWNGASRLDKFISDLRGIDYPKQMLEFIIHDNASSDVSCELIENLFSEMREEGWARLELIRSPHHPGLNRAYVNAYNATSEDSEFILEMDNDIRLPPDALHRMISIMRSYEKAAVVGCNVRYASPPYEQNCGAAFHDWWFGREVLVDLKEVSSCDAILDCVMLLRRSALSDLAHYFHPDYYFFCLGTDMFLRFKQRGWLVLYDPEAWAYHDAGRTTTRHSDLTDYLCVRDGVVLQLNHNKGVRLFFFLVHNLAANLKCFLMTRNMSRLKGWIDGVRRKPFDLDWWEMQIRGVKK